MKNSTLNNWRWKKKQPKQVNIVKVGWLLKTKYTPLPDLIKKLDTIFSQFKRLQALMPGGYIRCFTCGKFISYREADCGHYVGRECMATRFLEKNTECQCHSCNRFSEGNKNVFAIKLIEKYGSGILEYLEKLRQTRKFYTTSELEELIAYYKPIVEKLKIKIC